MSRPDLPEGPSEATRKAIRAAIAADLGPVQPATLPGRLLAGAAMLVVASAVIVATYGEMGVHAAVMSRSAIAAALGVLASVVIAMGIALSPRRPARGPARAGLAAALAVGWSLYVLSFTSVSAIHVDAMAIGCAARSVGGGLVAAAALTWLWRRADPWTPRWTGALIGAAAGCIACAAVSVACPGADFGHLLVGHWLAVPLLAASWAALASRWLRP